MSWSRQTRTKLRVETIYSTGLIDLGTVSNPIPESGLPGIPFAHLIFDGSDPSSSMRLGLVTTGPVRIHGAVKPEKLQVSVDPRINDTTIQLDGNASTWKVGDVVVVVSTSNAGKAAVDPQYKGPSSYYRAGGQPPEDTTHKVGDWAFIGYKKSHDEVRTITAINGRTITLDKPLAYNHLSKSAKLPRGETVKVTPIVASLSRSIRVESAKPEGFRGHCMFAHNDDVQVRWAEALNMGRTRQDPSLAVTNNKMLDKENGTSIADPNNVRGRYPWHTHLAGPHFARKMVVFEGLTAWAPADEVPQPGWGITHHGSRAAVEKCVVYNVRGAGIVSELGNEIGQWIDNVVCWARGDGFSYGWGMRGEIVVNHQGSAGIAYENQARQILQLRNWATSSHIGWSFLQQNNEHNSRVPDHRALRLVDPWVGGGAPGIGDSNEGYGVEQAQIPDFHDNICVGVGDGFFVAHRQYTNRQDQLPMVAKRFHCIGVSRPVHIENYSFFYSFYDFMWVDGTGGHATRYGDKTAFFNHANGYARGYSTMTSTKGYNVDGWFAQIDHDCTVATPFDVESLDVGAELYADPTKHKLYPYSLRMGGWVKLAGTTIKPRPTMYRNNTQINFNKASWNITVVSDKVLDARESRQYALKFQGTITDGFGTRPYPHWSWFDRPADEGVREWQQSTETPTRIVERNGCFKDASDGNKWKARMYFVDHNRLTGDYIIINFDIELVNFAEAFLEANKVIPSPPSLPLDAESITIVDSIPSVVFEDDKGGEDSKDDDNGVEGVRVCLILLLVALTLHLA